MDKEERLLIEDLVEKYVDSKVELVEEESKEEEAFNPVIQPWRALKGNVSTMSGPTGQELRDLIWKKKER